MLDDGWIWKRAQKDCEALRIPKRRVHDLRRTGITLFIEDGADSNILKRGTHAPPRTVMDLYTSIEWAVLCREVAKLKLGNSELLADEGEWRAGSRVIGRQRPLRAAVRNAELTTGAKEGAAAIGFVANAQRSRPRRGGAASEQQRSLNDQEGPPEW
jgi:hypothetical protein